MKYLWRFEKNLWELLLYLHFVVSGTSTWVISLGSNGLYFLSYSALLTSVYSFTVEKE